MDKKKKPIDVSKYQQGGLTPIYVDSPDDPRYKAYQKRIALENSRLPDSYYNQNLQAISARNSQIADIDFALSQMMNYSKGYPTIDTTNIGPIKYSSKDVTNMANRPVIVRPQNKKDNINLKKDKNKISEKEIERAIIKPSSIPPSQTLPSRPVEPVRPTLPNRPQGVVPPPRDIPNKPNPPIVSRIPEFTPPKFKPTINTTNTSNAYNDPILIPVHKSGPGFSYLSHYENAKGEVISKEDVLKFINKYQQGGVTTFEDQVPSIIEVERQSTIDQINSPEYLQRLNNFPEDYGNPQQTVDNRTKLVKDTKVIIGADPDHAGEVDPGSMAYTNPSKKEIRLLKKEANRINSDLRHEFGHAARGIGQLSQGEYDYVSKRIGESTAYGANAKLWETDPNEYHTRIFSARGQGQRHGLSRTRFGNTSEEDILRLINSDKKSKYAEEIRGIFNNTKGNTPEEKARNMKEVWNTVAQNNSKQKNKVQVAKYGGEIKKFPGGGPIGNYPDAINNWKEYNGYVPTVDPPSGDVDQYINDVNNLPFLMASPFMGALVKGNLDEKNMRTSDIFNPVQGFNGFAYNKGGSVNTSGYSLGSNTLNNDFNVIPGGHITSKTMPKDLEISVQPIYKEGLGKKIKYKSGMKDIVDKYAIGFLEEKLPFYKNGGVIEGDFEIDNISKEEIERLNKLGYKIDILND